MPSAAAAEARAPAEDPSMGDAILALALFLTSLVYFFLRLGRTHPLVERLPLFADVFLAVFGFATGGFYLCGASWSESMLFGLAALTCLVALAVLARIWCLFPALTGYRPWEATYRLTASGLVRAHVRLVERLRAEGLEIVREGFPGSILARLPGNKVAWDYRRAPKALRIVLRETDAGVWAEVLADYPVGVLRDRGERAHLAEMCAELLAPDSAWAAEAPAAAAGKGPVDPHEEGASPWRRFPPEFILPLMILVLLALLGIVVF